MHITINIKADNIPADFLSRALQIDELKTILGVENLRLDAQRFSSEIGNEKRLELDYTQKND